MEPQAETFAITFTPAQLAAIKQRVESMLDELPTEYPGDGWPETRFTYEGVELAFGDMFKQLITLESALAKESATVASLKEELAEQEADRLRENEIARQGHVSERNIERIYEIARFLKQCRRPDLARVVLFEMSCHSSALSRVRKLTPPEPEPAAACSGNCPTCEKAESKAVPTYEQVSAAADKAGFGAYMLSREAWDRFDVDHRFKLLLDLQSGAFKQKVLDALNVDSAALPTQGKEGGQQS
jgi:hypothetical protein